MYVQMYIITTAKSQQKAKWMKHEKWTKQIEKKIKINLSNV